jgi:hypothetical protein
MEVKAMLKKIIIFVCMLVLGIISILIFSPHVWAFYTSVFKDPYGVSAAEVEVTSIIGYQGTSWTYLVKNINISPFIDEFGVQLPDSVTVKSSQCPPNFYSYGVWSPQRYEWSTWLPGSRPPVENPGIPPGATGIFSFQTTAPAMMNINWGFASGGYIETDGYIIGPSSTAVGIAFIREVSGVAIITTGTTTTPAVMGATITALDKVQTGPDSYVNILFSDGSLVVLQGNSMFSIGGSFGLNSWIVNEIGKIWNSIAPNADNSWNIDTPNCAIGDRGTTF